MKNLKSILLGILFLCLFANAFSQSEDRVWLIDEAMVKPEQVQNFEQSLKEMTQLFKENSYPHNIYVYRSTGFKYYFMRELESLSSYDELTAVTEECWLKIDQNVLDNYNQCFVSGKKFVLRQSGKYSYQPKEPRISFANGEIKYVMWDVHYVKFDKLKEYYEVLDKFTELVNKHNFDDPVLLLSGIIGTENPMSVGVLFGKDANDLMDQNRKMWDSFGEEGSEMYKKMIPLLRNREKVEFWYRRDLSYYKE